MKTKNQVLLSFVCTSTVLVIYPDLLLDSGLRVFNDFRPFLGLDQSQTQILSNLSQEDVNETIAVPLNVSEDRTSTVVIPNVEVTKTRNNEVTHLDDDSAKNKSETKTDSSKPEKLFVIVAYRDRAEHKKVFVSEMNTYLSKKECYNSL